MFCSYYQFKQTGGLVIYTALIHFTIQSGYLQPMECSAVSGPPEGSLAAPASPSQGKKDVVQVISSEGICLIILA